MKKYFLITLTLSSVIFSSFFSPNAVVHAKNSEYKLHTTKKDFERTLKKNGVAFIDTELVPLETIDNYYDSEDEGAKKFQSFKSNENSSLHVDEKPTSKIDAYGLIQDGNKEIPVYIISPIDTVMPKNMNKQDSIEKVIKTALNTYYAKKKEEKTDNPPNSLVPFAMGTYEPKASALKVNHAWSTNDSYWLTIYRVYEAPRSGSNVYTFMQADHEYLGPTKGNNRIIPWTFKTQWIARYDGMMHKPQPQSMNGESGMSIAINKYITLSADFITSLTLKHEFSMSTNHAVWTMYPYNFAAFRKGFQFSQGAYIDKGPDWNSVNLQVWDEFWLSFSTGSNSADLQHKYNVKYFYKDDRLRLTTKE
ncbi:hypothetical protein ABE137_03630 [Brevibacillus laterosporus]